MTREPRSGAHMAGTAWQLLERNKANQLRPSATCNFCTFHSMSVLKQAGLGVNREHYPEFCFFQEMLYITTHSDIF